MARRFPNLKALMRVLPADGQARHLIRRFNQEFSVNQPCPSMKDLAIDLGFDVRETSLPGRMMGRLVRDPFAENGYRIEVEKSSSVQGRRWTVMHEIAHYFLHVDIEDAFDAARAYDASGTTFYIDNVEESEANAFAEAVFFADGALTSAQELFGQNYERLSRHFGLNNKVIQIAERRFGKR